MRCTGRRHWNAWRQFGPERPVSDELNGVLCDFLAIVKTGGAAWIPMLGWHPCEWCFGGFHRIDWSHGALASIDR